ncbi:MAG: hypothetical protein RL839_09440 [Gammaproteobacteria bacterium]
MNESIRYKLIPVFRRVKTHFRFTRDIGLEEWTMPPEHYNGQQTIRDDCDGFCLACRVLLSKRNIRSRLVYCEIKELGKLPVGHLVVEVEGWILDNLQDTVVANHELPDYRWLRISGYQPGDDWHEIL